MDPTTDVFASLSKNKILKDVSNEITTFLMQDPPKTASESKPETALEKMLLKATQHLKIAPFWTPIGNPRRGQI